MADFRDAKTYKSSREAEVAKIEEKFFPKWWQTDDPVERVHALIDTAKALETNSTERHQANLRFARMYENVELDTLAGSDFALALVQQAVRGRGLVRINIVASVLDTLAAKIVKNKPKPTFLTSGGSWDKQQKARRLDRFCRGLFYETDIYEKAKDVFFDCGEFGTGFAHVFLNKKNRLEAERAMPDEMFVDDVDALYGHPRQLFRRKVMQREVLLDLFPEKEAEIYKADPPKEATSSNKARVSPAVETWEAWHLPSGDSGGGHHVIAIDGHELFHEEWKLEVFPFIRLPGPCGRGGRGRTVGFWGKGVAEALTGLQIELNRLILSVSEQLRRKGRGRIFLQVGSKVNPNHLTNDYADVVWYVGQPPVVDNQNAVAPEEFMQIDRIRQQAYQEVGISELSAAAKKPSGLDAAVALREYSDIESERFALIHQAWEQFFMHYAVLCLELIREQYGDKGYTVRLPNRRYVQEIEWRDIDLERDAYSMQIFPSSSLPSTPGARYQKVTEMMSDGFIDKPVAQRLLEFPDIEAESNLGNAAIDDVDATISAILDEVTPKYMAPEPYQNLDLLISRSTAAYLFARHHECPEDRLDMLRNLINTATQMKSATMMPPPGTAPGAMPMPAGMAAPSGPAPGVGAPPIQNQNIMNGPPPAPAVPPMVA